MANIIRVAHWLPSKVRSLIAVNCPYSGEVFVHVLLAVIPMTQGRCK